MKMNIKKFVLCLFVSVQCSHLSAIDGNAFLELRRSGEEQAGYLNYYILGIYDALDKPLGLSDCVGGVQLIALQDAVVNYLEEYPSARVLPMYSLFTLAISDEWSCDIPNEALNKMQEKLY